MMNKLVLIVTLAACAAAQSNSSLSTGPERLNLDTSGAAASKFLAGTAATDTPSLALPEGLEMTSAAMEAAITNLMLGKGAFGATPMGGSVKQISDILKKTMLPKVLAAHNADQKLLNKLANELSKCGSVKNKGLKTATPSLTKYKKESGLHKKCRKDEAVKFTSKKNCLSQQRSLNQVKKLKCAAYAQTSKSVGTQKDNTAVVKKAGGESVESYVTRITGTFCGSHNHGNKGQKKKTGGWGGGLAKGYLDKYLRAKDACKKATTNYQNKVKECNRKTKEYNSRKAQCDQYQALMDASSCKGAVITKDVCESYAGCYFNKKAAYNTELGKVSLEVRDRKAEWRGLNRMSCLISAFADGKVTNPEVDVCKKQKVNTDRLTIKYPKLPALAKCKVPQHYPSTGAYKKAEFAPLPALAKGKPSPECSGVQEISLKPRKGSPKGCKCRRVTLNGPYSAGPMVKCSNCRDVRRSKDTNSCPRGTKLFSPASRADWKTFLSSAKPLRAPNWIVDVTRPSNGCGGCTGNSMNSGNKLQKKTGWATSDGSPWWLRSSRYSQPDGDYTANCYLDIWKTPSNENSVTFNDGSCSYHAKSYYCQPKDMNLAPGAGSPKSCKCQRIELTGSFSPGSLVKCEQCLDVRRSTQKNSCPKGMKLFSPRNRGDWTTFLNSASPLSAPHWIIDITRPSNGCGGCTKYSMKSTTAQQATWRTKDASPWYLRNSRYGEPSGDYHANCYMGLGTAPTSADTITMNDGNCNYHSRSYYCQTAKPKPKPTPKPTPAPAPVVKIDHSEAGAKAYCKSIGWKVKWTESSKRALICTSDGRSAGHNCDKCSTWRLVVFKNGGTDMSPSGQAYQTNAGHYYCGHAPCRGGWNLPYGAAWAKSPITKNSAEKYCTKIGWKVQWRSSKSVICTSDGRSAGHNCDKCSTWRLVVFTDTGADMSPSGQTYGTIAGNYYCGHAPCRGGWNLPTGGKWY